ncbi:hypothetical protein MKZ38_005129 [Zalerion maritima]|uniref:protein-L-isoaspartate(D-aspartate) O-methyltransferase n=1 Tax=Zalerion maritima TaxID=339359 RepID=A0AAD5WQG9_9PEZI|nr:hypothetical protein MKZ38_005129 [Zalerion maritima]
MAWRCSGGTNEELIRNMASKGLIKNDDVKEAFIKVDRAHYAPNFAYEDSPQTIGYGATISAPHMHASALEYLLPFIKPSTTHPGRPRRILDVGSGSGYLCHVMAELAGDDSKVVGIEHIQGLVDLGRDNMARSPAGRSLLDSERVRFVLGDGRKGWKEPTSAEGGAEWDAERDGWDAIHVGAASKGWHQELLDQLRRPGRMFIPVEDPRGGWQDIWVVDKDEEGGIEKRKLFGVRYVPLTDAEEQLKR